MTESYDQFLARTNRPARPLWASALVFLSVFFILQMAYGASRGSAFEHFVIGICPAFPAFNFLSGVPLYRCKVASKLIEKALCEFGFVHFVSD